MIKWEERDFVSVALYHGIDLVVYSSELGWTAIAKEGTLPGDVIGTYGTRGQAKAGAERWAKKNYGG